MPTYEYRISGLTPDAFYRLDTASGSSSPASVSTDPRLGRFVSWSGGESLRSDNRGNLPVLYATVATLYAKTIGVQGALGAPTTVTGTTWSEPPTGGGGGGALTPSSVGSTEVVDGALAAVDLNLASVAAAVADRPELTGTFAPINGLSQTFPMRRLAFAAAQQQAGTTKHVRWLTFGSSVADMKIREIGPLVVAAYGGYYAGSVLGSWSATAGPSVGGVSFSTVTNNASSGTITDRTDCYDAWVTGLASQFGASGSRTYGAGGGAPNCDNIEIYYVTGPASASDGGTFSWKVDAGSPTNVSTVAGSIGIGRVQITPTLGAHTVTVAHVSGNVRIIGVGYWDSTSAGLVHIGVGRGGLDFASVTDAAFANWQTFLGWVTPDVITHEMKDSQIDAAAQPSTTGPYSFTQMKKWLATIVATSTPNAGPDVVLIGSTPATNDTGQQLAVNQGLATLAATYRPSLNVRAWDGWSPIGPYANVLAMGWQNDGTHLAWQAQRFLADLMARDLGLFDHCTGAYARDIIGNIISTSQSVKRAADTTPALLTRPESSSGLDVQLLVNRRWSIFDKTGATEVVRFDSAGGTPFIPALFTVGSTGAGIRTIDAKTLQTFINTNGNTPADLRARTFIRSIQTISISSNGTAISPDLNNGSHVRVSLTANAGALTLGTGINNDTQECVLEFRQDATGGRTLPTKPSNVNMASGVTWPTDTTATTATKIYLTWDSASSRWFGERVLTAISLA